MRIFLKAIMAVFTIIVGVVMGIYLLNGFVAWKIPFWALGCSFFGKLIDKTFKAIDKKFLTTR